MDRLKYLRGLTDGNEAMLDKVTEVINCMLENALATFNDNGDAIAFGEATGIADVLVALEDM